MQIIERQPYYVVVVEPNSIDGNIMSESCRACDGSYIGTRDYAKRLCDDRGIKPERAQANHRVASVGFCAKESKWYGWSHRAMYGFSVGSIAW